MPQFGMATMMSSAKDGGKAAEHLFLGLALVHPAGQPDKGGVIGVWVHNGASLRLDHKTLRLHPPFAGERDSRWVDKFWLDIVSLALFDPGVIVYVGRSIIGLSNMDMAKNTFVLNGTLGVDEQQRTVFTRVAADAAIDDIMAMLPEAWRELPPDVGVQPASGIVPAAPSFEPIAFDVFSVGSKDYRVGGGPGQVTGGAAFQLDGETRLGVLHRRPWCGTVELRVLRSVHDYASEVELDGAWLVMSRAQVLTSQVVWVDPAALLYPIKVVHQAAFHAARLDSSVAYPLVLVADRDGMVSALEAPLTRAAALTSVLAAALVGDKTAAIESLFQEVRSQTVPENQSSLYTDTT